MVTPDELMKVVNFSGMCEREDVDGLKKLKAQLEKDCLPITQQFLAFVSLTNKVDKALLEIERNQRQRYKRPTSKSIVGRY